MIPLVTNITDLECVYWTKGDWSNYGVETRVNQDKTVTCLTNHLSFFAVRKGVKYISF